MIIIAYIFTPQFLAVWGAVTLAGAALAYALDRRVRRARQRAAGRAAIHLSGDDYVCTWTRSHPTCSAVICPTFCPDRDVVAESLVNA